MTDYASKFMLQEHSRMIDVYQDLHVQKNELLKVYLAFVSIPVSIIAIFLSLYRYLNQTSSFQNLFEAFQKAAIYLSFLLIPIGIAVFLILLKIRGEQYLYVQAVNGARKFFQEKCLIDKKYLILPSDPYEFTFAQVELEGRPFWEAMIVGFTTSMILAFLAWQESDGAPGQASLMHDHAWPFTACVFLASAVWFPGVQFVFFKCLRSIVNLLAPDRQQPSHARVDHWKVALGLAFPLLFASLYWQGSQNASFWTGLMCRHSLTIAALVFVAASLFFVRWIRIRLQQAMDDQNIRDLASVAAPKGFAANNLRAHQRTTAAAIVASSLSITNIVWRIFWGTFTTLAITISVIVFFAIVIGLSWADRAIGPKKVPEAS